MQFEIIHPSDFNKWNTIWNLYENSFPAVERRKVDDHLRAFNSKSFRPYSIWEDELCIGILFFWEYETGIYLEHLAVNPDLRGGGYGAKILQWLKSSGKTIVLEIEPITDETTGRRLRFYQREGFSLSPFTFEQLPYRKNEPVIQLLLVSYPHAIDEAELKQFTHFMHSNVMDYCEK